uniref:HintN domain-containing protein n=1 Tax=Syphacia muris TaxID=451379 RepID=A0A0N5ABU6_9BILA
MRLFQIATLLCFVSATHGSSCGEAAIPFSFEALENGQPVLGCARPTCFGWTADARPVSTKSQFYRINGVPDGFLRKSTELPQKVYQNLDQNLKCFASSNNTNKIYSLSLQCCTYDGLRQSTDRGVAVVKPGQIVIGGEVTKKGRQYAFDYISDIVIRHGSDKRLVELTVYTQQVPQYVYQVAQPQPQPQYYYQYQQPVQYYQPSVPAAVAGGYWCFSADTLVHTSKGKDVRMDELTLNDWVLARQANKLTYLPVKSWLHRLPKQKAQFQQISLEDGTSLKLTNLHYIYKTNCQRMLNCYSGEIKAGDCVLRVKGEQVMLLNIVVNDTGIFAPLTASGDIVANGVHTSCFAVLHSNAMQSVFFDVSTNPSSNTNSESFTN